MHVNFFTSFPKIFRRNPTEVEYKTIKTFDMDSSKRLIHCFLRDLLIKKLKTLLAKPRDLSVLQILFSLTIFTLISFLKYFC